MIGSRIKGMKHKRKIGNHCGIYYSPGELIDDLDVNLLTSSTREGGEYVMIDFWNVDDRVSNKRNETQTKNWQLLRNALFSRGAD